MSEELNKALFRIRVSLICYSKRLCSSENCSDIPVKLKALADELGALNLSDLTPPSIPSNPPQTLAWLIDPGMGSAMDRITRCQPSEAQYADVALRHGSITELVARIHIPDIVTQQCNVCSGQGAYGDGPCAQECNACKGTGHATIATPTTTPVAQEPVAWYVPHLLEFGDRRTSCPPELIPQFEGNVAWGVELLHDDESVIDKNGVEHKPRPLVFGDVT